MNYYILRGTKAHVETISFISEALENDVQTWKR